MKNTLIIILTIILGTTGLMSLMAAIDRKNELKNAKWFEVRSKSACICFIPLELWKDEFLESIEYNSAKELETGLYAIVIPYGESRDYLISQLGKPTEFSDIVLLENYWNKQKAQ